MSANMEYNVWMMFIDFGFIDHNTSNELMSVDSVAYSLAETVRRGRLHMMTINKTPPTALFAIRSSQVKFRLDNKKHTKTETGGIHPDPENRIVLYFLVGPCTINYNWKPNIVTISQLDFCNCIVRVEGEGGGKQLTFC